MRNFVWTNFVRSNERLVDWTNCIVTVMKYQLTQWSRFDWQLYQRNLSLRLTCNLFNIYNIPLKMRETVDFVNPTAFFPSATNRLIFQLISSTSVSFLLIDSNARLLKSIDTHICLFVYVFLSIVIYYQFCRPTSVSLSNDLAVYVNLSNYLSRSRVILFTPCLPLLPFFTILRRV